MFSAAPTGSKRRKVSRTVINSKGEEITEEVWEEEPPTGNITGKADPEEGVDLLGTHMHC